MIIIIISDHDNDVDVDVAVVTSFYKILMKKKFLFHSINFKICQYFLVYFPFFLLLLLKMFFRIYKNTLNLLLADV